jgi:hypothetical protein
METLQVNPGAPGQMVVGITVQTTCQVAGQLDVNHCCSALAAILPVSSGYQQETSFLKTTKTWPPRMPM